MAKVLVIVPFPMSEENRRAREAQLEAVRLGPGVEFHFRPVRAAPANYTSEHDSVLADVSILDAAKHAHARPSPSSSWARAAPRSARSA